MKKSKSIPEVSIPKKGFQIDLVILTYYVLQDKTGEIMEFMIINN